VNLPIVVKTENALTDFCTWHVDTRNKIVREFIEDGFIKIEFNRSAENDSDSFTKNVFKELNERLRKNFLEDSEDYSTN
jgi:hypothetical protein